MVDGFFNTPAGVDLALEAGLDLLDRGEHQPDGGGLFGCCSHFQRKRNDERWWVCDCADERRADPTKLGDMR
jgi:hypothetical protein